MARALSRDQAMKVWLSWGLPIALEGMLGPVPMHGCLDVVFSSEEMPVCPRCGATLKADGWRELFCPRRPACTFKWAA